MSNTLLARPIPASLDLCSVFSARLSMACSQNDQSPSSAPHEQVPHSLRHRRPKLRVLRVLHHQSRMLLISLKARMEMMVCQSPHRTYSEGHSSLVLGGSV